MGEHTGISWTDHTFNYAWGCVRISDACLHCYAETLDKNPYFNQTGVTHWGEDAPRRFFGDKHWNEPLKWNRKAEASGERKFVFCASMADVFESLSAFTSEDGRSLDTERARLWELIKATPWLCWLLLTKRPANIRGMVPPAWLEDWPDNVWCGTTVESSQFRPRIRQLAAVPAPVLFLSCEPICGSMDGIVDEFHQRLRGRPGWVIGGGESGKDARPFPPAEARRLRDDCTVYDVFTGSEMFFWWKQWGEFLPIDQCEAILSAGQTWADVGLPVPRETVLGDGTLLVRVGTKTAGAIMDGRLWHERPDPGTPLTPRKRAEAPQNAS